VSTADKCVLDKVIAYKEGLKMKVEEGAASVQFKTKK
jgi:5-(carboxyamino)imidazole ribonucleotide mutase